MAVASSGAMLPRPVNSRSKCRLGTAMAIWLTASCTSGTDM
jgi:hypothetical protein